MKINLLIMAVTVLMGSTQALADHGSAKRLGDYICRAVKMRQLGNQYPVNSRIFLKLYEDANGIRSIHNVTGHVEVGSDYNSQKMDLYSYYGIFRIEEIFENQKYQPKKYKNYSQFKDFNAIHIHEVGSGSGMWGNFVLEKSDSKTIDAHYIFQAGDHMGGTIDYKCTSRY